MSYHEIDHLLARRRDRSIAIVLGLKERECDEFLPDDIQRKLRKVILDQFNDLTAFCQDMLDSVPNEEYLDRLTALTAALEEVVRDG